MARNWAIAIGINQYQQLESLRYAKRDAQAMRDYWMNDAKFDQVYYIADDAEDVPLDGAMMPMQPTYANVQQFLQVRFGSPCLTPEDTLWVFVCGHGLHDRSRDYLLLEDSDPTDLGNTGIAMDYLAKCLRRSGAGNVLLMVDACRTPEQAVGQSLGTDPKGITTLYSAGIGETAHEFDTLQHGCFTFALLEGLRLKCQYRGATVERLFEYLRDRVPELNCHYGQYIQNPRIHVDSGRALDTILIPHVMNARRASSSMMIKLAAAIVVGVGITGVGLYFSPLRPTLLSSLLQPSEAAQDESTAQANRPKPIQSNSIATDQRPKTRSLGDNSAQGTLKTGIYYATNPQLSSSRREISKMSERYCIKMVDGSDPNAPKVTVSSLTVQADGAYVDATQERLKPDNVYAEFTDGQSVWQLLETKVDRSGAVAECLATRDRYTKQMAGEG